MFIPYVISKSWHHWQIRNIAISVPQLLKLSPNKAKSRNRQLFHLPKKLLSDLPVCTNCHHQQASFHTSPYLSKKKILKRKPLHFNPKTSRELVALWKNMTVQELAHAVGRTVDQVFELFLYIDNTEAYDSPSSQIDQLAVSQQACKLFSVRYILQAPKITSEDVISKDIHRRPPPSEEELVLRHPVVTIMGHVDHGKTTLLDYLRHSSIVDQEFGGITQHIGAFEVSLPSGEKVTFIDTPGHAAFTAIRARGANITDIIVLVVAAEDGVMEQTRECIKLAQDSEIPIIVAINKIDKDNANVKACRNMLLNAGVQLESEGGDVQGVEISALKGININSLIESLVTQAELMNLRGDPKGLVEGSVIESSVDPGRGKAATCIIQRGTLRKGAILVSGTAFAKVRNMFNDSGESIAAARPGTPVQVIGWRDLPNAGDDILEVKSESVAKQVLDWREQQKKLLKNEQDSIVISAKQEEHLQQYRTALASRRQQGFRRTQFRGKPPETKMVRFDPRLRLSLLLKADVDGSVEAILDVLDTYQSNVCPLDIISCGVGPVTENEVLHTAAFKGVIYTFNIKIPPKIRTLAQIKGVPFREHNIIYRLVDDLKEDLGAKMPAIEKDEVIGEANVQEEFLVTEGKRKVPVAGCLVTKGILRKDLIYKVFRGEEIIHEGQLDSMRHLKNEVNSVKKSVECGLRFQDVSVRFELGDTIVCFEKKYIDQKSDWNPVGF